jgi:subtilisin family serine protease
MNRKSILFVIILLLLSIFSCQEMDNGIVNNDAANPDAGNSLMKKGSGNIGINVVLNTAVTDAILDELNGYGNVLDVLNEINAVRILAKENVLSDIINLTFVEAAAPDAERDAPPVDTVPVEDFTVGYSPWNLDVINVTEYPYFRTISETGEGVIVGVLDTGLKDSWRQYFPQERILSEYAKSFSGGGAFGTNVSEQPNKWEHDQNSHGTHVTSTIIGYNFYETPIAGVAPMAKIVPVKVLNQNGSGWSSVIARGIMYMAELKEGPLADFPVVINMSLGGSRLDPVEQAAIDYAISKGIIIVASAGNRGPAGMGYPGAYQPVISVAASGWQPGAFIVNVPESPDVIDEYYIATYSSRARSGQDLDVTAPGDWVVGPYQLQSGKISYYYLSGTSMASPHVAGIVALMAEKDPGLTADDAETILETAATPMPYYTPADCGSGLITADAALSLVP